MLKVTPLMALVALFLSISLKAEESDLMEGYYGNTWEYIGYDGTKYLNIASDHTFEMLHFDNRIFQGRWDITGERVCFYIGEEASCFIDMAGRNEGEHWEGIHHTGNVYKGVIHPEYTPVVELQKRAHAEH